MRIQRAHKYGPGFVPQSLANKFRNDVKIIKNVNKFKGIPDRGHRPSMIIPQIKALTKEVSPILFQ